MICGGTIGCGGGGICRSRWSKALIKAWFCSVNRLMLLVSSAKYGGGLFGLEGSALGLPTLCWEAMDLVVTIYFDAGACHNLSKFISMPSEPQNPPMEQQQQHQEQEEGSTQSKKVAKLEKQRRREEKSASGAFAADAPDPLAANYGDVPLEDLQSKAVSGRKWIEIANLNEELKDQNVLIRGQAHAIRSVSKKMAFLVVRERGFTVQCVLSVAPDVVSLQMVKFAIGLSKESYVDVEGTISVSKDPIIGASQQQ
ncbi:unnamed protein product [Camellia sinensis]